MTIAVLAEKPSVARDIAKVLGASKRGEGYLHGNGFIVTWAIGHLVTLAQPHEINSSWKTWKKASLPMIPDQWPLQVLKNTSKQFSTIKKILNSKKVERIICATDAGREGELIFRYIYEAAYCKKPISRLWISSLTATAIKKGFENLKDGKHFEDLAASASARSRADWLVGLNLSRAYTISSGDKFTVGRVQTPTLAMIVDRELAIRDFVAEKYIELVATFSNQASSESKKQDSSYQGTWFDDTGKHSKSFYRNKNKLRDAARLPGDGERAKRIGKRVKGKPALIEFIDSSTRSFAPPLLFDLTELQRKANRLFGFSAKHTLSIAQALYEKKKLISYPRTDSRYLSRDVASTISGVLGIIKDSYGEYLPEDILNRPLASRFVNDSKIGDHHAIIPTSVNPDKVRMNRDEKSIYDLICKRLLCAWLEDHITKTTTIINSVATANRKDCFFTQGVSIEQIGWKALDGPGNGGKKKKNGEQKLPPGLQVGSESEASEVEIKNKQTKPPKRFNDATLLTAMETAGKTLDDKELSVAMKERGLGTPATRAAIIEALENRGFVNRQGKAFVATAKGERLIEAVHPQVKSPAMTGEWERKLKLIELGEADFDDFMKGIESYVCEVIGSLFGQQTLICQASTVQTGDNSKPNLPAIDSEQPPPPEDDHYELYEPEHFGGFDSNVPPESEYGDDFTIQPSSKKAKIEISDRGNLDELLKIPFGLESFRPYQRKVCRNVIEGNDVLLVMPTGAGKSLCYQLPGIARDGTTIVISPLISLMENQVESLQRLGLSAERIHSGRPRAQSRMVCRNYLDGQLDYLFIAPERLAVSGFPEMLTKNKPVLIAVDEAHCISHWGHDFRPDYRLLADRLHLLRPAPVIAMTATATPLVQNDIVEQLAMRNPRLHIHGFRRTNIAIEFAEMPPASRTDAVFELLKNENSRPAIVYAPTRKKAEQLAEELKQEYSATAYHAGMSPAIRDKVQDAFFKGDIEVMVATIAFGMGIDKADIRSVIHLALPSSLESYYQEIGRAGRDGLLSHAICLHSYADRKLHQFFHEKSYPPTETLFELARLLQDKWKSKDKLLEESGMEEEVFDAALEKLWIHGGAQVDPEENARLGIEHWNRTYDKQRKHQQAQLEIITRFAASPSCRMLELVRHFGDREDSGETCGICDICAPGNCLAKNYKKPGKIAKAAIKEILAALSKLYSTGTGRLYKESGIDNQFDRNEFERLLEGICRAGLISLEDDSFDKDGRTIHFRRVRILAQGMNADDETLESIRLIREIPISKKAKSAKAPRKSKRKRKSSLPAVSLSTAEKGVAEALRQWRLSIARQKRIPAFSVMNNRTLTELASRLPKDEDSLLAVKGIGPTLLKKYGKQILAVIEKHRSEK